MKKVLSIVFTIVYIVGLLYPQICEAIDTCAKAAVVMDVNTARVLYSKNSKTKLAMASTTKIMTTLVAIESGKLNEKVKVSRKAANTEGSSIYLRENEQITVEELLYGIMLRSGNDAAMAVAEYIGGSIEGFAEMMNKKAEEIGAKNTHFVNPHGLDNTEHYTTAYDLALITCYALKNPKFKEIVSTKKKSISGPPEENWDRVLINKNKMLWQYDGGDGVKTGYTSKAGRCLVSSASKDEWQLVCVVLDCQPMWEESTALLNYGFNNYINYNIIDKSKIYKEIKVFDGKKESVAVQPAYDIYAPLREDEIKKITLVSDLQESVYAPIKKGLKAGDINVYIGQTHLGTVSLTYCDDIESNNPMYYLKRIFQNINCIPNK